MDPKRKAERLDLLTIIGEEVLKNLQEKHSAEGGDPSEIVFCQHKLVGLVDDYEAILEDHRYHHIGGTGLVAGDKIAAFTGTLIMRHWIFESQTGKMSTIHSAFANEIFATRAAQGFVKKESFGLKKAEIRQLINCFGNCYSHDDCMRTWTVATMELHLADGTYTDTTYSD